MEATSSCTEALTADRKSHHRSQSAHFQNKTNVSLSAVHLGPKNVNSEGIIYYLVRLFYQNFILFSLMEYLLHMFFYSEIKCENQPCNRQQMLILSGAAEQCTVLCHTQLWNA